MKKKNLEEATLGIDQVIANPRNPRNHPQEQIERLVASLKKFGQTKPIVVRKANHMIIAGHGICEAAKRANYSEIKAVVWDVDQKTADAFMLADNRHGDLSTSDEDRVAEILRELEETDYMAVGYSGDEVGSVLEDLDVGTLEVEEIDTSLVDDKAWVSIRCPLSIQNEMLDRLKTVMADLEDVEVDLGTVASS